MKTYSQIQGDGGSRIVEQVGAQQAALEQRLSLVKRIIAVASGKGGVGKSAIAAGLAQAFALRGRAVGMVDADLNGPSVTRMLGVEKGVLARGVEGISPVVAPLEIKTVSMDFLIEDGRPVEWQTLSQESFVWRGTKEMTVLREFLSDTQWGSLDVLIVDCPPGSDRLDNMRAVLPLRTEVVLVVTPSYAARQVVARSATLLKSLPFSMRGVVENMGAYHCRACGHADPLLGGDRGEEFARALGMPFLGTVPFDPVLNASLDRGEPFLVHHSDRPSATAILSIANTLMNV